MEDVVVKFLGSDYLFPKELKKYVVFCHEFEKISNRLSQALLVTMSRPTIIGDEPSQSGEVETTLKENMRKEGRLIISMLAKYNIFDTTESDLVDKNKGYIYYEDVYKNIMMHGLRENLMEEMNNFRSGIEQAHHSANSQITGTGISMYSNSMIAHMTLAAFETSTVKKQCENADKTYKKAMELLIAQGTSTRDKNDAEVMIKTYAEIAKAFGMFVSELMDIFLNKLQEHNVFNYSKIKPYNIERSSELLNNMELVDNKRSILIEAFKICPYNPDIYASLLELGICDLDTFKTAKEFYQDSLLLNVIENYCNENLKFYDKVETPISILAYYKDVSITDILKTLYESELISIQSKYGELHGAIEDKRLLDKWIRKHINQQTESIVAYSLDTVRSNLEDFIKEIISPEQYLQFINIGILSMDILRLKNSAETELSKINLEIINALMAEFVLYVDDAKNRKQKVDEAYSKFNTEIKHKEDSISEKKKELLSLGVFAFSRKKELKIKIENMESDLIGYKLNKEPRDLKEDFEKMYR